MVTDRVNDDPEADEVTVALVKSAGAEVAKAVESGRFTKYTAAAMKMVKMASAA